MAVNKLPAPKGKTPAPQSDEYIARERFTRYQKCTLRDGAAEVFAKTYVLDPQPKADTEMNNAGPTEENVLVVGKQKKISGTDMKMTVVSGWEKFNLFAKPPEPLLKIAGNDWPSVLSADWTCFLQHMSPDMLADEGCFLIHH